METLSKIFNAYTYTYLFEDIYNFSGFLYAVNSRIILHRYYHKTEIERYKQQA